ncbi:hypothetical protein J7E38_13510 [Bacillus sp. ISL-35]|uniref:hypothetical protein n=1 Tax=Bacillus sp. ISL-35 TaxID=2819122 RepID=UPI001BE828D5|nr:hypothetical protein [Bacillus sp. ISL-35]MBT2680026.1 hypothetical protein [Bacillus sp. ISL-35]MBT2702998.1 hypothetical protein [Chryseobacterium sp. ISL-80]
MPAISRKTAIGSLIEQFLDDNESDLSPNMFSALEDLAEEVDEAAKDLHDEVDELQDRVKELEEELEAGK